MQDRASFQQLVDDWMIGMSDVVLVQHASFCDDPSGPVIFILERDGDAFERTRITAAIAGFGVSGGSHRLVKMREGDRVIIAINRVDMGDLRLKNVDRR